MLTHKPKTTTLLAPQNKETGDRRQKQREEEKSGGWKRRGWGGSWGSMYLDPIRWVMDNSGL